MSILEDKILSLKYNEIMSAYYLGRLQEYLRIDNLLPYFFEFNENREVLDDIEKVVCSIDFFRKKKWTNVFELGLYRIVNYIITRALKPEVFVETGVLHGLTSNCILSALNINRKGKLLSVDYPSYYGLVPKNQDGYNDTLPPNKEPGWIINNKYISYWRLYIGKSVDEIPKILNENKHIDIFLHDSEHTYETMWNEFNLVWDNITNGGLLICDNILTNNAFDDFCKKVNRTALVFPEALSLTKQLKPRFGIIQK